MTSTTRTTNQPTQADREHIATVSTEKLSRWLGGEMYVPGSRLHTAAMDELHSRALAEHDTTPRVFTFADFPITILGPGDDADRRFLRVMPTGAPSLRRGTRVARPAEIRQVRADLIKVRPAN